MAKNTASKKVESTLEHLAAQINKEHNASVKAASSTVEHARRAGELLIEAKDRVEHGQWLPWLKDNFPFTTVTAQNYMRIAREWPQIVAIANTKGVLYLPGVAQVLRWLADPNADDDLGGDDPSFVRALLSAPEGKGENPNPSGNTPVPPAAAVATALVSKGNDGNPKNRKDRRWIHVDVSAQVYGWWKDLQKASGQTPSQIIERLIHEAHKARQTTNETETTNGDSTDEQRLAA